MTAEPKKPGKFKGAMGTMFVIFAILYGIGLLTGSSEVDDEVNRDTAIGACHKSVQKQLKSPSSAQFSSETATETDGLWSISGMVDADNSFGAALRTTWTCEATDQGGGQFTGLATLAEEE